MSLTIRAEDLKALRKFEWSPSGVGALVGPNGAGKSTALRILQMIQRSMESGYDEGLRVFGSGPLANLETPGAIGVVGLSLGDVTWKLRLDRSQTPGESADRTGAAVFTRGSSTQLHTRSNTRIQLKTIPNELVISHLPSEADDDLRALATAAASSRAYSRPDLVLLRNEGSVASNDVVLEASSRNLFAVLRNWRDRSEHEFRFEFVNESLRFCFPWFRRLDFENWGPRQGAQLPSAGREKLLPSDWSDGFITMLCHLTGIASVDQPGVISLDEPENSLHPELIVKLLEITRDWSRERAVTVILATHSPVVLDQFRDEPEKVFVMQPGHERQPVPLDQLKQRDWLQHFSLGDLYSHLEVGASSP